MRHQQNRKRAVRQIKVCSLVHLPRREHHFAVQPLAAGPQVSLGTKLGMHFWSCCFETQPPESMCLSAGAARHPCQSQLPGHRPLHRAAADEDGAPAATGCAVAACICVQLHGESSSSAYNTAINLWP